MLAFFEPAVLLLDTERSAAIVGRHEVDLAVQGPSLVLAGPVHAVEHRVIIRQGVTQHRQRFDFRLVSAAQGQTREIRGDDSCHRAWIAMDAAEGALLMQEASVVLGLTPGRYNRG